MKINFYLLFIRLIQFIMNSKNYFQWVFHTILTICFSSTIIGQAWVSNLPQEKIQNNEELTLFEIQKAFNDYWEPYDVVAGYYTKDGKKQKAAGWKQFKRWEWYWEPRVDPTTGAFPKTTAADIRQEIRKTSATRVASGDWSSLGPTTTSGGYAGIGRLNCIAFIDGDNDRFYVGSPSGGLWKTTDGGTTWDVLTDDNDVLGVSDAIAIPTAGDDIIYIGTGDRDGGSMWSLGGDQYNDNNSIGVLKSTDGGTTWSTTALSFSASSRETVNRLLKHPTDDDIIYAATSDGLYKTTNGGTTWPLLYSTNKFVDLEFKPGDPTTIYGSTRGGDVYTSTNSGTSWTNSLNLSAGRVEIAVSPDEPTWVYAVAANSSGGGFNSVWRSTNSGTSFSERFNSSSKNLLGWNCDGGDSGGQGGYDLCIAADPNDATIVFVGGVNTWKSTNSGAAWSINNHWSGTCSGSATNVHADKHFFAYQNGTSTLFECNDGGLYKTSNAGSSWSHLGSGLVISQLYRLGVSQTTDDDVIAGLQDNGTKSMLSGTWNDVVGGDGFECAINPTDEDTQYGALYYGRVKRTTNGWGSSTDITLNSSYNGINGITESGYWCTPYLIDPNNDQTLYIGMDNVWKSTNQGNSWSAISSWGSESLRSLTVAPSNSDYIYAAIPDEIHATTNGGTSWSEITGTLPVGSSDITYISVKDDDPSTIWVSMGNYNSHGVYESTDGGSTWTNISTGLPSIPVMCVIQNKQNTADVELYAGTDVGVYVKVGSANWTAFNTNLPNVVVTELDIYYNSGNPNLSRLRAATYGRGVWESELYSDPNSPPSADFSVDNASPVVGATVNFTDMSLYTPTNWFWSFDPATVTYVEGTSSTSQNPKVQFTSTGSYEVSLYAENANGNDTEVKLNYITVSSGSPSYCTASGGGDEYISGVEIGSISNTGTSDDDYADYTSLSTDLSVLSSNNITITNGNPYSQDDLGIWIDFNQDGDFDDTNENVVCTVNDGADGTYSISVPASASLGSTRMRIRIKYWDADCGSPCGDTQYGEVEDYTVNILAGDVTWEGNTSTDWATGSNWSNGEIPTSSFNVTIPSTPVGGNFPEIQSSTMDAATQDLDIESGASLMIYGYLTVDGTLTNNAGISGLVVKSSASQNGSLITNTNNINATVERYLEGGEWHLVASSVDNETVESLFFNHNPDVWLKEYDEDAGSSGGWTYITPLSTPMPLGKGFGVWVENGYNVTPTFENQIRSTDLALPSLDWTDANHGYNLLGNPFPCPISWDQGGWTRTNLDGSVWVYDPATSNYKTRNDHGIGSLTDGIIPMSSGFFVRATASGASITIPALARVHHSQPYYNPGNESDLTYVTFEVTDVNNKADEVWLAFDEDCTEQFDNGWDVKKFFGEYQIPQLYSVQEDMKLSINALPLLNSKERAVDLYFEAGIPGEHELNLIGLSNMEETGIYLEDKLTGHFQELMTNPQYQFHASTSDPDDRFIVHFNPEITGIGPESQSDILVYAWQKTIYVKNDNLGDMAYLQVFDLFGREIIRQDLEPSILNSVKINANNAHMIVRIIDGNLSITKKVFVR